jgi:peptidoglycan/xylan/chitin deacetylase (PgdA/CDA1 family)
MLVLAGLLLSCPASRAETPSAAPPPGEAAVEPPACLSNPDLLGVSRIVEIDTSGGPKFGEQYRGGSFLADGEVVLTFDDGPLRRYTLPILDALDEQCTKATFFSVGRMAIADPATLKEIARRGHTIGSHTWSHQKLKLTTTAIGTREIELGASAVSKALGAPVAPFFRFPYLADTHAALAHLADRGIATFGIDIDSRDFRTHSPGAVLREVLAQLKREKKGILLFHDIQPSTAGAIGSVLVELKMRGFKVVHLVAKAPTKTLAEYDALAEKALTAKALAAASNPLAERAVSWPVAGAAAADTPGTAGATATTPTRATRRVDWGNLSNDPWQLKSFGNGGGP